MSAGFASPSELANNIAQGLLLDVRTPAEFQEVHIEGAVSKPLHSLNSEEIKPMMNGKSCCYVICRSGGRAQKAAEQLAQSGISPLKVLEGGILAWEKEGLPVTRSGQKTISLERQVRIAAGALVFVGSVLGYFNNPAWIALSGFVGAGLIFAGITDTCGLGMVIAKMPWNNRSCTQTQSTGPSCCSR
jgi:rhodanese-related sulfurtransferase